MPTVSYGITNTADDVVDYTAIGAGVVSDGVGSGGYFGTAIYAGLRFPSVAVPQGATITSASLTLKKDTVNSTAGPWGALRGVNADSAPAWTTTRPGLATTTTQSVTIVDGSTQVYDVAAIVQAIVNRAGWTSGSNLAFAGVPGSATGAMFWIDRATSSTDCAQLSITYTEGSSEITGSLTATVGTTTLSAAATALVAGALAATLAGSTLSATGTAAQPTVTGSLTATLAAATLSGAGSVTVIGSSTPTYAATTASASGSVEVAGASSTTSDAWTLAATAEATITGAASPTYEDTQGSGDGVVEVAGAAALTLDDTTLEAEGVTGTTSDGTLTVTFADTTVSAEGAVAVAGEAAPTLADATLEASGAADIVGALSITFADTTLLASGPLAGQITVTPRPGPTAVSATPVTPGSTINVSARTSRTITVTPV